MIPWSFNGCDPDPKAKILIPKIRLSLIPTALSDPDSKANSWSLNPKIYADPIYTTSRLDCSKAEKSQVQNIDNRDQSMGDNQDYHMQ